MEKEIGPLWHCPLCGKLLKLESTDEKSGVEFYSCKTGCFADDFPLTMHHPFDVAKGPGDSWSLSWIA